MHYIPKMVQKMQFALRSKVFGKKPKTLIVNKATKVETINTNFLLSAGRVTKRDTP